jgi:hypothetical protein
VLPRQALKALERIVGNERHVFWPDDVSLCDERVPLDRVMGHRQLTDAYLLGLAIRNGGRLVTLDRSISSLLPARDPRQKAIVLIGEQSRQKTNPGT